ncbi:MAG TPA: AmmeMemoRadiSam system protein A [Actinobacteria bacterium]|nr:AmmeMemoRadiSam system protein A [Actinomycetota bacterium]
MSIVIGCITPHPPILVPEIGGSSISQIEATQNAMYEIVDRVAYLKPDTLIFISPHSPAFSDAITIKMRSQLSGSLAQFGAFSVSFQVENDVEMAKAITDEAGSAGIPVIDLSKQGYQHLEELDHGVLVPLYFLREKLSTPIVSLSISYLSYPKHYQLGVAIQRASERLGRRVAFIASGDLSHRLTSSAPAGYNPRGIDFDLTVKKIIERAEFPKLLKIDESLIEDAGECGLRSLIALGGVFEGQKVKSRILSYEGPFGVGYMVAMIEPIKSDKDKFFLEHILFDEKTKKGESGKKVSEPVKLARKAVENYIKKRKTMSPPDVLSDFLKKRAGVFVCIKKDNALRGCIGTTVPCQESIAEEIIKNAIQAATCDPRFPPIRESELLDLEYSVDVLGDPEPILDESHLDPKKYGVIVRSGFKTGLLLPDLDGVDSAKKQVNIAMQKAGLQEDEPVELFRFEVKRYK